MPRNEMTKSNEPPYVQQLIAAIDAVVHYAAARASVIHASNCRSIDDCDCHPIITITLVGVGVGDREQ